MRKLLHRLGTVNAREYRTHDLRRGHSKDMKDKGSRVTEILRAGEWRHVHKYTLLFKQ